MNIRRGDSASVLKAGCIVGLAAGLRLWHISRDSLWEDEVFSATIARSNLATVLRSEPTNPPLFYLLLHFWSACFGTSEAALRSVSAVAGVLATWLTFRLASRLFGRRAAFIAMSYQAVSTFQIFYSQEARCFAWLGTLVLAGSICLWNALHANAPRREFAWYAGYSALILAALYMHFISVFFVAAQGLYVLIWRRSHLLKAGASILVSTLLFYPWLRIMLTSAGHGQFRRYMYLKLPQAYFSFLFGDTLIPLDQHAVEHVRETLMSHLWILAIGLAGVAFLALNFRRAARLWGEGFMYVCTLSVAPVILAYLASLKTPFFDERYLFPASLFVYIAIAAIVESLRISPAGASSSRLRYWLPAMSALWCGLLLLSLHNYYFNPRFGRDQWRDVVAYIENRADPRQAEVFFENTNVIDCYDYYRRVRDLRLVHWNPSRSRGNVDDGVRTFWLIRFGDPDTLANRLRDAYQLVDAREFPKQNGIWLYEFSTAPAVGPAR